MLKNINTLLHGEALHALDLMGHGDTLVICDANFPAASTAECTPWGSAIRIGGDAVQTLEAVLSVVPVDTFDLDVPPVRGMGVVDDPKAIPQVIQDAAPLVAEQGTTTALVERYQFYKFAAECYVVLHTTEVRPYGNFIVRKGVIF